MSRKNFYAAATSAATVGSSTSDLNVDFTGPIDDVLIEKWKQEFSRRLEAFGKKKNFEEVFQVFPSLTEEDGYKLVSFVVGFISADSRNRTYKKVTP